MQALKQEIHLEARDSLSPESKNISDLTMIKWFDEITSLVVYFVSSAIESTQTSRVDGGLLAKFLGSLVRFWTEVNSTLDGVEFMPGSFSLKAIVVKVYLDSVDAQDSCPISSSPYFGLQLLRLIQDQERGGDSTFRHRHGFDDQFMLRLLERTQLAIRNCPPGDMVSIQQMVEQMVDVRDLYRCPNQKLLLSSRDENVSKKSIATFPLELVWRKILRQFSQVAQDGTNLITTKAGTDGFLSGFLIGLKNY